MIPTLMALCPLVSTATADSRPDELVATVFRRQAQLAAAHADATHLAEYRYEEFDAQGRLLQSETCTRRVYTKGFGRQYTEFLGVAVNCQELEGRSREAQIRALKQKGLAQDEAEMPFRLGTRDAYEYELLGEDTCLGRETWMVGFEPKRKTRRTVIGRAWVEQRAFDVLRLEFRPARLPWVCRNTRMVLHYSEQQGHMLPCRFEMDMDVVVKVIVTFAQRKIRVEDRFSAYRFNLGLPDSLFD